MTDIAGQSLQQWQADYPLIQRLLALEETVWFNEQVGPNSMAHFNEVGLTAADIQDAADRLKRFAPYLARLFPAARSTAGILESPLVALPDMQAELENRWGQTMPGQLWAKLDSHLPVSGSIKARGGIYEVLKHAEALALEAGLISLEDDYRKLDCDSIRQFFSQYRIAVGSTGNLGLSIGIMSAKLGFKASVHMSSDARQWKKDRLREHGVDVVEYDSDYSSAVAAGRQQAEADPSLYFVDDENSRSLFLGYAVAGQRLAGQLQALDVRVSAQAPLFVYLPCGVGGGPGGVAFGLKAALGDAVRCIFVEPTHSPAMMLGVYTGLHDQISVQDFAIDNMTAADGLAVGRPSGFVGQRMQNLIDGYYTVTDDQMFRLLALFNQTEGLVLEPSAAAGLTGPFKVATARDYLQRLGLSDQQLAQSTHLAWLTGGAMVPDEEMQDYIKRGQRLL